MTENPKKKLQLKVVPDYLKKLQELKDKIEPEEQPQVTPLYKLETVKNASAWLYETFPSTFFQKEQKSLKVNILHDIFEYLASLPESEDKLSKASIRKAMKTYTHNRFYLKACVVGADRIDLKGEVVSQVLESEAEYAKNLFDQYLIVFKARQKAQKQKKRVPPRRHVSKA